MMVEKDVPFVSVVMISYNHEKFIKESLMSVVNQESDKYKLEILIVDDGSNDHTQQIITKIQNNYPHLIFPTFKEHIGITAINKNLNEQIKKARGDYIAILAGDDSYTNGSILKELRVFENNDDNIEIVIGEGRNFCIEEKKYLDTCQEKIIVEMLKNYQTEDIYLHIITNIPALFGQGFLLKKTLLEKIDYFDEDLIADDWILNIRLFKYLSENKKNAIYLEDEVFKRNLHKNSTSSNHKEQFLRVYQVIQKYVDKNRQKEMIKELYLTYFAAYARDIDILNSCKFFLKYFLKDPLLILLIKKIKKIVM